MPKPRYKTTNWKKYSQSFINRGSLTFWIDEEAIREWAQNKQNKRGQPRRFSGLTITTVLMVKVDERSKHTGRMVSVKSGESFTLLSIQALMKLLQPI